MADSATWPLTGLLHIILRPQLCWRPLVVMLATWAATVLIAVVVLYWHLPAFDQIQGWWSAMVSVFTALALAASVVMLCWLVLVPVLLSLALAGLVRKVLHSRHVEVVEEDALRSLRSSLQVLLRTLHWRLAWPLAAFATVFLAPPLTPLGLLIAAIGTAHCTALDACDTALALRGQDGAARAQHLSAHRSQLLGAALVAAGIALVLVLTGVGWLLFAPAMFVGAALWVGQWELPPACAVATPELGSEPVSEEHSQ